MAAKKKSPSGAKLRLKPDELRWTCPPRCTKFRTTDDITSVKAAPDDPHAGIVGQRRAVDALALGLEIEAAGYNVFVTGPVGTGRTTTVMEMLECYRTLERALDDKCYVNNFKDPDQPTLLRFPAGLGRKFCREMDEFIDYLAKNVPARFESDEYQHKRAEIVDSFKEAGGSRVREFEKKVAAEGFTLVQTAPFVRPDIAPIVEKQPVSPEALPALVEEGKISQEQADAMKTKLRELTTELAAIFKDIRGQERDTRDALQTLDRGVIAPMLDEHLADLCEACKVSAEADASPRAAKVRSYLADVRESVLDNIDLFRQPPKENSKGQGQAQASDPYLEYRVNVLVDNSATKGAPVVFETNPNYKNLFGSIERLIDRSGQWRTDFTKIKAGSVMKADRGFLVLNALDVLIEPGVWPALKRTLRNRRLETTAYDPVSTALVLSAMKPEKVAIDLKVVMIGDPYVYGILAAYDEDFKKVFKVRADFDWTMDLDDDSIGQYCRVIKTLCDKESLVPFDQSGVRHVLEYGVRIAGRRGKLSTKFNIISELLNEASFWARKARAKTVKAEHVDAAITKRRDRVRLYEQKFQEMIDEGTLFIDVTGSKVGQVNGLAVYEAGEHSFGKPSRITAKTGVGSAGIINIEREAQLSGPTHDKGIYILSGYLRNKFAQDQPLVLSASITFEQSYGGVDGDSASSTEVYALLSDLSGLPIRQDLAVTGSVNQHGEVQPIGGVNYKIEGFFETCRARGLTGTQGVLIPHANLKDLMLRREVVDAVKKGKFSVYAVKTIDQGIELLTGVPAGKPGRNGRYPEDSVHGRVKARLTELARIHHEFNERDDRDLAGDRKKSALKKKAKRKK